ncbi:MAG: hypothetical protein ACI9VM_000460 [Candidatus Azotimanducaceae bacterium]|jgi:hypothetical protein
MTKSPTITLAGAFAFCMHDAALYTPRSPKPAAKLTGDGWMPVDWNSHRSNNIFDSTKESLVNFSPVIGINFSGHSFTYVGCEIKTLEEANDGLKILASGDQVLIVYVDLTPKQLCGKGNPWLALAERALQECLNE